MPTNPNGHQRSTKRQLSSTSSQSIEFTQPPVEDSKTTKKNKRKKQATVSLVADYQVQASNLQIEPGTNDSVPHSMKQIFQPLEKNFIENEDSYPISFVNFQLFVDMCKGAPILQDIVAEFSADPLTVIQMLQDDYPLLTDRSMKIRFTKIITKLQIELEITKNSSI